MADPKETPEITCKQLLSVKDCCDILGVSRNTFMKQCKQGMWPTPFLLAGNYRFQRAEFEAAMAALPRGEVVWNYVPKEQRAATQ